MNFHIKYRELMTTRPANSTQLVAMAAFKLDKSLPLISDLNITNIDFGKAIFQDALIMNSMSDWLRSIQRHMHQTGNT